MAFTSIIDLLPETEAKLIAAITNLDVSHGGYAVPAPFSSQTAHDSWVRLLLSGDSSSIAQALSQAKITGAAQQARITHIMSQIDPAFAQMVYEVLEKEIEKRTEGGPDHHWY